MRISNRWCGACAALLIGLVPLASSTRALAQGVGVLTGTVRDAATHKAISDVVVTVTSPALQGEQVVVTDAAGQYRIPELPPGVYTVHLDKEEYKPFARSDVTLRVDTTIRMNSELLPEALKSEEIVVVASPPTVDVESSTTGVNVGADFVNRIALNPPSAKGASTRSFESLAEVAPGATADQYGVSISGTTSNENQYVIDGLSVNNPDLGTLGTPLSVEFVKEVNVITGGYMPEYGRSTGGYLDVVTKTGSNEFHGSIFSSITPGIFEGPRTPVKRAGSTISTDTKLALIRDFGVEIGGPILKDKLWFYAGFNPSIVTYRLRRTLNLTRLQNGKPLVEDGLVQTDPIPGTEREYKAVQKTASYIAKLTYLINQDNNITASIYGSPSFSGGSGGFGINPNDGSMEYNATSYISLNPGGGINGSYSALAHEYVTVPTNTVIKWSSAFKNKTILFDGTLGWHHEDNAIRASDGTKLASGEGLSSISQVVWQRTSPGLHPITDFERSSTTARVCDRPGTPSATLCPVTTYFSNGPGLLAEPTLDRYQAKGVATVLLTALGHHVAKGGLDVELMRYHSVQGLSGTNIYQETTDGTAFSDYFRFGSLVAPDTAVPRLKYDAVTKSTTVGGFVQDSWNILDRVTLNAGVRYDAQLLYADDGRQALALPNEISPRIGVIYDFTQAGRSKLFANYARFYEGVPLDGIDRAFSGQHWLISYHDATFCHPGDPAQQKNQCESDQGRAVINKPYDPNQRWIPFNAERETVDPDVRPQSSDEIVLGGEYEVFADTRLGAQYTKRYQNRVIEDMSRNGGATFFLGNPGYGIAKDFPKAVRNYDAFTIYLQRSFKNLWLVQASYTLSYLRGNWSGLFIPENGTIIPNLSPDFDLPELVVNHEGPLPGDHTHQVKIFGAKDFIVSNSLLLSLGLTYRGLSGAPTNFLGAHPLYGADSVFILPRGSGERLPWVHDIDSHLGVGFKLAKESTLFLSIDAFNLFNFQSVTARDQRYTQDTVSPIVGGTTKDLGKLRNAPDGTPFNANDKNPNFGKPTTYQPPRTFRLGARVTF